MRVVWLFVFFHGHVLVGQVRPKKHVNRTRRGQRVREWLPCAVHGQMMLGDGRAETAEVPTGVMETKGIFQ